MSDLFGTDGIRGVAGSPPLDSSTLRALAVALAEVLREAPEPHRVLIGRDTRLSGGWIERLLTAQLTGCGVAVASVRVVSTPAIAFITREWKFSAGIVISASHNPARYNGIKIFSMAGTKLDDRLEERIEARIAELVHKFSSDTFHADFPLCDLLIEEPSFTHGYLAHLRNSIGIRLDGMRLVVDCAHGANWRLAPRLFKELGADGLLLGAWPDGNNINAGCGSLHPEAMCQAVRETEASLGICFDGDGDRVIMADERGNIVDGDHVLYLFARCLNAGKPGRTIVGTVMSNLGLEVALDKLGYRLLRAPVGDRFVYEKMLEEDAEIGGEQSGHVILRRFASTGDGLLTALQILGILQREKAPLSSLLESFRKFPQVLVNVNVERKPPLEDMDGLQSVIAKARMVLGQESRIVVRYSGTEPLARVMIEGRDRDSVHREAHRIAETLRTLLA